MKSKEEILIEFGCPEVPFDENVTMYHPAILSAMDEYADQFRPKWPDQTEIQSMLNSHGMRVDNEMYCKGYKDALNDLYNFLNPLPAPPETDKP